MSKHLIVLLTTQRKLLSNKLPDGSRQTDRRPSSPSNSNERLTAAATSAHLEDEPVECFFWVGMTNRNTGRWQWVRDALAARRSSTLRGNGGYGRKRRVSSSQLCIVLSAESRMPARACSRESRGAGCGGAAAVRLNRGGHVTL